MKTLLSKAIALAVKLHDGQVDKGGRPYILHPLHVMMAMDTEEEMIVAILHDVIEDKPELAPLFLNQLGLPTNIRDAIEVLTRQNEDTYSQYIEKIAWNDLARKVKMADLEHNSDLSRLPKPILMRDLKRQQKYKSHLHYLQERELHAKFQES